MRTSKRFVLSNPETLVLVQAFAPYSSMVEMHLPYWQQHGCPVIVTAPENSPCTARGVLCVRHGEEGHAGAKSLDRWRTMLEWMTRQPFNYFSMHESDSVCLSAQIPRYCYEQPDVLWSNEMPENGIPPTQQFYCVAPWFMSQRTVRRLLDTCRQSPDRPPYHGDRWVGQMAEVGGIPHKKFEPGIGCGTIQPGPELEQVCAAIRAGAVMIHGVKTHYVLQRILQAHYFRR